MESAYIENLKKKQDLEEIGIRWNPTADDLMAEDWDTD